jgi:hypothetical protein
MARLTEQRMLSSDKSFLTKNQYYSDEKLYLFAFEPLLSNRVYDPAVNIAVKYRSEKRVY